MWNEFINEAFFWIALLLPWLTACGRTGPDASAGFVYSFEERYPLNAQAVTRIDLPAHKPTASDEQRVRNAALQYLRSGQGKLVIFVPSNGNGALSSGNWVKQSLIAQGVPQARIQFDARPLFPQIVRLAYVGGVSGQVWNCTNLNEDVLQRAEEASYLNRQYTNFGCAYQSNMRAQADNQLDFIRPHTETPLDAVRTANAVRRLRDGSASEAGEKTTAPAPVSVPTIGGAP